MSLQGSITVDDDTLTWQLVDPRDSSTLEAIRARARALRAKAQELRLINARVNALVKAVRS